MYIAKKVTYRCGKYRAADAAITQWIVMITTSIMVDRGDGVHVEVDAIVERYGAAVAVAMREVEVCVRASKSRRSRSVWPTSLSSQTATSGTWHS